MAERSSLCRARELYRDGRLEGAAADELRRHVTSCESCRRFAARLDEIVFALATRSDARLATVSDARIALIARSSPEPSRWRRLAIPLALAAAASVFLLLQARRAKHGESARPAPPIAPIARQAPVVLPAARTGGSRPARRLAIGPYAEIALSPDALLGPIPTGGERVPLLAGALVAQVRPLPAGARFVVAAGETLVRVHGTRFLVARHDTTTTVAVEEGVVEVDAPPAAPLFLRRGEASDVVDGAIPIARTETSADRALLTPLAVALPEAPPPAASASPSPLLSPPASAAVDPPPATPRRAKAEAGAAIDESPTGSSPGKQPPPLPSLEECRRLLEGGDARAAATCCERLLALPAARSGRDDVAQIWLLLGDARRIAGRVDLAANAYQTAASVAPGGLTGENALFEIARMYTPLPADHDRAIAAWRAYLAAYPQGSLRPEAERALDELLTAPR